jgi:cell division protein FtsA
MSDENQKTDFSVGLNIGATQTRIVVGVSQMEANELLSGFSGAHRYSHGDREASEADRHSNRSFHLLASAIAAHNGIKRGNLVDMESITQSVRDVVDEVERQSGLEINDVRMSLASTQAISENFTESIALKTTEIRESDREKLLAMAYAHGGQPGFERIATLIGHYIVDGRPGIVNPLGMYGNSLGGLFHRISIPDPEVQNFVRAVNHAGLHVESIGYESLSSAEAALDSDERDLGSICINFGAHLTHVVVYSSGSPIFSKDFAFGSHHITKDIAIGLRTTQTEAERIKRDFAHAYFNANDAHESFSVQTAEHLGGIRQFTRGQLMHIVEPRVREVFGIIHNELKRLKLNAFVSKGIVLTGGGSLLPGLCWVAEDVFGVSARVGYPLNISGVTEGLRSPLCTSTIGLLSPLFAPQESSSKQGWKITDGSLINWARSLLDKLKTSQEII